MKGSLEMLQHQFEIDEELDVVHDTYEIVSKLFGN